MDVTSHEGRFANGAVTGAFAYAFGRMAEPEAEFAQMQAGGEDFVNPTEGGLRGCDRHGCGGYGASRAAGPHDGADYVSSPGQVVQSPVDGVVLRVSNPYAGDSRYSGLVVNSAGGHQVTVWYISPNAGVVGTTVYAGQGIGIAQNLGMRYSGITNHVHVRMHYGGQSVNPTTRIPTWP